MASLRPLFGGRTPSLIGVDIGSSAIKVLQLSRHGRSYSVDACAIEAVPPNAVAEDGQIPDPVSIGEIVRRALTRAGSHARNAAVAVPTSLVIDKHINLAAGLRETEMEDQIRAEADQHINYPLDEVHLDFAPVGTTSDDESSVDVLLVACRKENVEARAAAVEAAGLHTAVVDIHTYALEGACQLLLQQLPDGGAGHTVAIVDIGATTLSLLVLDDLKHAYAHDQNFGGAQLTEEIARHFDMRLVDAEKAKLEGDLPADYGTEMLPRFFDDLAQQIQRALQYFYSSAGGTHHAAVEHVLLAGGCARLPGLAGAISERLELTAAVAEPFALTKLSGRTRAKQVREDGPSLLLAAGLALRAFDEQR